MRNIISDRNKKKLVEKHGKDMEHSINLINNFYLSKREKKIKVLKNQLSIFDLADKNNIE
jgi:hypothetical protein